MVTVSCHDANLNHNFLTGKSVSGVLQFLNKTLVNWDSKKQAIVETATCGYEYSSIRTCVEHNACLRITLRHLIVPIRSLSYVFGDEKGVIEISMAPNGKMYK